MRHFFIHVPKINYLVRCVTKLSDSHRLNYIAGAKTNNRWVNNLFTILTIYTNHGPGPVICGKEAQQVNSHFMWVSAQQLKVSRPQGLLKRSPLGVPFSEPSLFLSYPSCWRQLTLTQQAMHRPTGHLKWPLCKNREVAGCSMQSLAP